MLRELRILRKLSELENNCFITRLVEIIIPENVVLDETCEEIELN